MNHLGTKRLETERLCLRPFMLSDTDAMYQNWASDSNVTRFLTWPTHENVDITRMVLSDWIGHYNENHFYQWAIVPKDLGQPIGSIAVVHLDEQVSKAEIGYCIGKPWWHQGFTSEALDAVIKYLIDDVGINRVEARHDAKNPNSGGVMRKCGMSYEGTLRQADRNNSGICDSCVYAVLAGDLRKDV